MEYTEQDIDKAINERLIKPLNKNCQESIKKLKKSEVKHSETIGLLSQAFNTISNSEKNFKKYNFADACTLLRATLEYIVMAYMIEEDEKTYNEFLILSNNDIKIDRKYTIPNTLLNKFGKNLNKIDKSLFCDMTKKERERLMTDLYDLLCKFTHASIVVSVFNSIKSKEEKTVLRILLSYNLYFVKIILMKCLNYFTKIDDSEINEETIGIFVLLGYIKIYYKIKKNNISFEEIKESFYYDTLNKQFYDYYSDLINKELYNDIMLFEKNENNIEVALRAFFNK